MLRLLIASAVCALLAGAGLAVAAGGVTIRALGLNVPAPPEKAAALQRLATLATTDSNAHPAAPPEAASEPIPARMLGSDSPVPVPPSVLQVRNGWLVSDGRTLVAVYAGAAGNDPAVGRLVIVRQDLLAGRQTVRTIDAGATGALTIAAPPLGSSVETSAQTGSIGLRTAHGPGLHLDLRTGELGGG